MAVEAIKLPPGPKGCYEWPDTAQGTARSQSCWSASQVSHRGRSSSIAWYRQWYLGKFAEPTLSVVPPRPYPRRVGRLLGRLAPSPAGEGSPGLPGPSPHSLQGPSSYPLPRRASRQNTGKGKEPSHCWQPATVPPPPTMTHCSFLCTVSPTRSYDLGIWGSQEKDAVCAQHLHLTHQLTFPVQKLGL